MKQNLIKVTKRLPDGKEVELLADSSQLEALSVHPDFQIPKIKESEPVSKTKNQIQEGEEVA
ncbi:hypothetical protein [Leptospira kmetyi]|uniref:Uncharacterized protein n=1 Tax=Leptospira kmetyi TaxID=408139 RepID=A0ABX4NBF4_9LEPT|nr:hypothetical protein [Leptospira kmetyi]PJZ28745.1 hypothetical protein CH378_16220 [Leptospira kmetyi]PJZ39549.1 hypothetical protein CH370_21095 [Leptospira kmetyi]